MSKNSQPVRPQQGRDFIIENCPQGRQVLIIQQILREDPYSNLGRAHYGIPQIRKEIPLSDYWPPLL